MSSEEQGMIIFTIKQAAELLQVSQSFIYHRLNEIPHYKLDHILRFDRAKLLAWLESKEAK